MNSSYFWYAIRVNKLKEASIKKAIFKNAEDAKCSLMIKEIFIPTYSTLEHKLGKKPKQVFKKCMPGYIMIQMLKDDALFNLIKDIPGVVGFLGEPPTVISDEEMDRMNELASTSANILLHDFHIGQVVRILDGPFQNFTGNITNINKDKSTCAIDVYILGRSTPVELSFSQIEKEA